MIKKLSLFSVLLVAFSLLLFACKKPYENFNLAVSDSEVVLYLKTDTAVSEGGDNLPEENEEESEADILISSKEITANVSGGAKNVGRNVKVSQVGNAVAIGEQVRDGNVTKFTITAKEAGRSVITVNTTEGNKQKKINVIVYKPISSVSWKDETFAISSAQKLNLNNYLNINPLDTNQKEMNFYINDINALGLGLDSYNNIIKTTYAQITNGELEILNMEAAPFNYEGLYHYVPVVAYSSFDKDIKTTSINIPIVNFVARNEIKLFTDIEDGEIELKQNALSEYEIILGSNITDNEDIFSRNLTFRIGDNISVDKNYRVSLIANSLSETNIVQITERTNHTLRRNFDPAIENISNYVYNNFLINQINDGEVKMTFKVEVYGFEGVFVEFFNVKVTVKQFPKNILVTDRNGEQINNGSSIVVYNQYGGSLIGAYLKVMALPEVAGLTFSIKKIDATNLVVRNSNQIVINNETVKINNGDNLYLTHSYTDNLPTNSRLIIVFTYTLAPVSASGEYVEYVLEHEINIQYKIGLSEINVPNELLINAANKSLILTPGSFSKDIVLVSTPNSTVNLFDSISSFSIVSVDGVAVRNIPNFNLNPINNIYFSIDYDSSSNQFRLNPNNDGLSVRMRLKIATYNGLEKEVNIIIFVPLIYDSATSPYVDIQPDSSVIFYAEQRGYNVSILEDETLKSKLARDEEGNYYDKDGVLIETNEEDGGESNNQEPLDITYLTTSFINMKTNSALNLNFYNYLLKYDVNNENAQIVRISYNKDVIINNYSQDYFAIETNTVTGEKVLRTKYLPTTKDGLTLTINFNGYDNNGTYVSYKFILTVVITRPLESISISPRSGVLYERSSVGSLNYLSSQMSIAVSGYPISLLTQENNINLNVELQDEFIYNYYVQLNHLESGFAAKKQSILDYINGNGINFMNITENGLVTVSFSSYDVAVLSSQNVLTAQLQNSLYEKIKLIFKLKYNIDLSINLENITYSATELTDLENEVINSMFFGVVRVRVYATAVQFNSLPVYAYNEVQIIYALKINNIILNNVDDDGIYFDLRNSTNTKTITLYTLPTNATNKNLIASIGDNTIARIARNNINSSGVIIGNTITIERLSAGTTTIVIAAQDSYVQDPITLISRPTRYIELRIKVADGSEENPFEIRSVTDFLNIKNYNLHYHYVLARDINLSGVTNYSPIANFAGGLNGLFTYYNTGVYYSLQNTIYGLTINKSVNIPNSEFNDYEDYNFGLFSNLTQTASIKNLVLKDVNIQVNFNKLVAQTNDYEYNKTLSVGAIAGVSYGNILNPMVAGNITVTTNVKNVNIGGVVGKQVSNYNTQNNVVTGYIAGAEKTSNSFNNESVNSAIIIKLISEKDINNFTNNKNLGGLIGKSENNNNTNKILLQTINNMPAISNIETTANITSVYIDSETKTQKPNGANAGGVVGFANALLMSDVVSTPFIFAYNNVGGVAGYAEYSFINNSVVQMYDLGYTGLQSANLVGYNSVGGLVGVGKNIDINYSYVRSYYNKTIDNVSYAGNIVLLNGENTETTKLYVGGLVGYLADGNENSELYTYQGLIVEDFTLPSASHVKITNRHFKSEIKNSYFNAEINTNYHEIIGELSVAGLVGGTVKDNESSLYIENSYAMANIIVKPSEQSAPVDSWVDLNDEFVFGTTTSKDIVNNNLVTTIITSHTSEENIREKLDEFGDPVLVEGEPVYEVKISTVTIIEKLFSLFVGNEIYSISTTLVNQDVVENEEQQLTTTTKTYETALTSSLYYTEYIPGVGGHYIVNTVAKTSYALINDNFSNKKFGIISDSYENFVSFNVSYENFVVTIEEQLGVANSTISESAFTYETNNLQNFENFNFNIISSSSSDTYYRVEIYNINNELIETINVRAEEAPTIEQIKLGYPSADYVVAYESTVWVIYENLNKDYPILLNNNRTKLLYRVLPSSMNATVLEFTGEENRFNNLAYVKVEDQKAVLFYNKLQSGNVVNSVNKYRIIKTGDTILPSEINNVIEINLNVTLSAGSKYQPEIDGNLIITSSNINVIKILSNGLIETVGEGVTTLTIAAKLNKNISTTVEVLVVSGVSNFNLYYNSNTLNTDNIVTGTETLYVDQTKNFYLDTVNLYSSVSNYSVYENNSNIGVLVSVSSANVGSIMLNNQLLETGKNYVYSSLNEFNLKGVNIGFVAITVTPFIKTNNSNFGVEIVGNNQDAQGNPFTISNVVMLNLLQNTYGFNVSPKATAIHTNNKLSATLSPQQTTDVTLSVVTSNINKNEYDLNGYLTQNMVDEQITFRIYNAKDNSLLASITNVGAGINAGGFNNSLLTHSLISFSYKAITNAYGQVLEFEISYILRLSFDREKYRETLTGVSYNLNEQNYSLVFTPNSNNEISARMSVNVVPNALSNITASFYAGNEITIINNQSAFNPQESSTDYIAPGKMGLLKLYLFPEFNNAEFVELTVNDELENYINFDQMLEIYAEDEDSNVVGYTETGQSKVLLDNNRGIRLRNLSLTTNGGLDDNHIYNGSYFVRVLLSALVPVNTQVVFTATAYNTVNGSKVAVLNQNVQLTVQPLPTISLSYQGARTGVMAVGTTIMLDLEANNFENIVMTATPEFGSLATVKIIHDEQINKYYLQVLDNATLGGKVFVTARASRIVNGMEEFSESSVTITVVEFIIDSVRVNGISSATFGTNTLETLNGTNNELSVSVNANYSKTAANGNLDVRKLLFESVISGKVVANSTNKYINNWYLQRSSGGVVTLEKLVHNNIYGSTFKFSRVTDLDNSLNSYWAISGMRVNSGTYTIVYKLQYYYNTLGVATPYQGEEGVTVYETNEFSFVLVIKDNSTYDHPNPIEKVEEFYQMQPGVHYILVQDIVLNNYTPRNADFASLDGNGYVIHINSFNFASDKANNATNVTTGIFKTVSSNTIIKNLTINISSLLITRAQVNVLNATNDPNVQNTAKINLHGVTNVTFGVLAGVNNGTLTNISIVNLNNDSAIFNDKLLFVYTTQGYNMQDGANAQEAVARIGTMVGVNNGSISNSYVGLNYYELNAYNASRIRRAEDAAIKSVTTYSFAVVGGKQIAGFVYSNEGTITNSYNKNVGVVNISAIFNDSKTAGFIIENSGTIYSAFVEGSDVKNFRASNAIYLEGKGYIGGFVYLNSGTINNAYSNITIKTNSGGSGGFVYENATTGTISNAYSAGNNYANNSLSHGLFTGVDSVNNYKNSGKLDSAFYLIFEHEIGDVNEPASPIVGNTDTSTEGANPFRYEGSFSQFSFTSSNDSENGIWVMNAVNGNYGPQLANSIHYNTFSHRKLVSKDTPNPEKPEEVIYNYIYDSSNTYDYGEKNNPILINTATDFVSIVIENSKTYTYQNAGVINRMHIFGVNDVSEAKSYVRLVNNLNFSEVVLNSLVVNNLRISDITFAGILDGNGMSMTGITLTDLKKDEYNENYGFFTQIGLSNEQFENFVNKGGSTVKHQRINPSIKNLNISIGRFDATNSSKVGALAGSIYDANLINLTLNGASNVFIQGRHLVGGYAGLIQYESDGETAQRYSLTNVKTNNIWVYASYSNVNLLDTDIVNDNGVAERTVGTVTTAIRFYSYKHDGTSVNQIRNYSYAGSIAGVLIGNNRLEQNGPSNVKQGSEVNGEITSNEDINKHRSVQVGLINNITAGGGGRVIGAHVGGLFGYVGENTHIIKASYIVENTTGEQTQLLGGANYTGGIVGENYGMLEKVFLEHNNTTVGATGKGLQSTYDESIANGSTESYGIKTLFGTGVNVAIGGIAGYSDNSIILDSYVKVGVVNPFAKIAGGLIGIATRKNYISHTYVTNDVLGKYMFGGVVGMYNQSGKNIITDRGKIEFKPTSGESVPDSKHVSDVESTDKLYLDYVVALNTWGTGAKTALENNLRYYYRNYSNDGGNLYRSFNLVLSEIGNQVPTITAIANIKDLSTKPFVVNAQSNINEQEEYQKLINATRTPSVYMGSLVGRVTLGKVSEEDGFNGNTKMLTTTALRKALVESRVTDLLQTKNHAQEVINESTVVSTTFNSSVAVLNTNKIYEKQNENVIEIIVREWPRINAPSVKGNIISYQNVVGQQLYNQALVGKQDSRLNYFRTWIVDQEKLSDLTINSDSKVWKISSNGVLPEYIVGIYSNYVAIDSYEEFNELVTNNNTASQYFVLKQNADEDNGVYYINSTTGFNLFIHTFKGVLIGEEKTVGTQTIKPTVEVEFRYSNNVRSIFSKLDSATISNINFIINIVVSGEDDSLRVLEVLNNVSEVGENNSINAGLFARNVSSSVLSNVNITINSNYTPILKPVHTIRNFGLIFGAISYGTISNFNIKINTSIEYETDNQTTFNYIGGFAALVEDSFINNINVFANDKIFSVDTNNLAVNNAYISGFVAYAKDSRIYNINNQTIILSGENINRTNLQLQVKAVNSKTVLRAGGILGYGIGMELINVSYFGNLSIGTDVAVPTIVDLYVGNLVGYLDSNSQVENAYVNSRYVNNVYTLNKDIGGNQYVMSIYSSGNIYAGGLIGYSSSSTIKTIETLTNSTNNSSKIIINGKYAVSNKNMHIGGIVGYTISPTTISQNQGAFNVFNVGSIEVTVSGERLPNISLGGIAGTGNGIVLENIYNYGSITINTAGAFTVGGIAGNIINESIIRHYAMYGDISNIDQTAAVLSTTRIMGGVFGKNASTLIVEHGISLARMNGVNLKSESDFQFARGIGYGQIITSNNNYFVYEFAPYDNMNAISYIQLSELNLNGKLIKSLPGYNNEEITTEQKLGEMFVSSTGGESMKIPYLANVANIKNIDQEFDNKLFGISSKLNPTKVTSINDQITNLYGYYLIESNLTTPQTAINEFNGVLIGKPISNDADADGYPTITLSNNAPLINRNNGVVANISVRAKNYVSSNAYFVNENRSNGIIINSTVYGQVTTDGDSVSFAGFVYNNNGKIIHSGSSIVFNNSFTNSTGTGKGFAGLVFNNNAGGLIKESYSTTALLNGNNLNIGLLVYENKGRIYNSYFGGYYDGGTTSSDSVIFKTTGGTGANNVFDMNADKSNNTKNGLYTTYLQGTGGNSEWLQEKTKDVFKTTAFIESNLNYNYGYPIIKNAIVIPTAASVTYVTNINETNYLNVTAINLYQKPSTSTFIPLTNGGTFAQIKNVKNLEYQGFVLLDDIDLSYFRLDKDAQNAEISSLGVLKNKIFLGNDKKIFHSQSETESKINLLSGYLFELIENSSVGYLTLANFSAKLSANEYIGILASKMLNSSVNNITIDNFIVDGGKYVGALAGEIYSNNSSSTYKISNVTVKNTNSVSVVYSNSSNAGGIVGTIKGTSVNNKIKFANNTVEGVYIMSKTSGVIGGIIGTGKFVDISNLNSINNKINFEDLSTGGKKYTSRLTLNEIGGVAGNIESSVLENIYNTSNVYGSEKVGGVVGFANNSEFKGSIGDKKDSTYNDNHSTIGTLSVGGIIGYANNVKIIGSNNQSVTNYGLVGNNSYTSGNKIGGLVGELLGANSTIQNATSAGHVYGSSDVGGIVGYTTNVVMDNFIIDAQIYYRNTTDIDGDYGYRNFKLGRSDGGIYDSGSSTSYSYFGLSGGISSYTKSLNREFGGLNTSSYNSYKSTSYKFSFGFVYGRAVNSSVTSTNTALGSNASIKDLYDIYTKYEYTAKLVEESAWLILDKDYLVVTMKATVGIRYYDSINSNNFLYGNVNISKVEDSPNVNNLNGLVYVSGKPSIASGYAFNNHKFQIGKVIGEFGDEVYNDQKGSYKATLKTSDYLLSL